MYVCVHKVFCDEHFITKHNMPPYVHALILRVVHFPYDDSM